MEKIRQTIPVQSCSARSTQARILHEFQVHAGWWDAPQAAYDGKIALLRSLTRLVHNLCDIDITIWDRYLLYWLLWLRLPSRNCKRLGLVQHFLCVQIRVPSGLSYAMEWWSLHRFNGAFQVTLYRDFYVHDDLLHSPMGDTIPLRSLDEDRKGAHSGETEEKEEAG